MMTTLLLQFQATQGENHLNEVPSHSTAWTKTGQDSSLVATPLDSFGTMHPNIPGSTTPFKLDGLTIAIIGEQTLFNKFFLF